MKNFLKKNRDRILLFLILVFVFIFSFSALITKPKLWYDEGLSVELSKNLFLYGKLDAMISPGVFSGVPYLIGGSGYPLTVPLAAFFYLFGLGPEQARFYMILWLVAFIFSVFFVTKKIFGATAALFAVALISTFAPFYGTGRTVLGDIPGLVFMIWGAYFLINKKSELSFQNYIVAGFLFGLAASSKASVYLLLFPAAFIYFVIFERENFFRKTSKFVFGVIPPLFLWLFLIFPDLFSGASWSNALNLYKNPYAEYSSSTSPFLNIYNNLKRILSNSTLLYLFGMFFAVLFAFLKEKGETLIKESFSRFLLIYGGFVLVYFLKSPGWFRYLLPLQTILLALFFPAMVFIFKRKTLSFPFLNPGNLAAAFCVLLIFLQTYHLFFLSSFSNSRAPKTVISFIKDHSDSSFGLINIPQISAFVSGNTFRFMKFASGHQVGRHPLEYPPDLMLDYVIFSKEEPDFDPLVTPYEDALDKNYEVLDNISGYHIFKKKMPN